MIVYSKPSPGWLSKEGPRGIAGSRAHQVVEAFNLRAEDSSGEGVIVNLGDWGLNRFRLFARR